MFENSRTVVINISIFEDESGGYCVFADHFPQVYSQGDTIDECLYNIQECFALVYSEHLSNIKYDLSHNCAENATGKLVKKEKVCFYID